MPPFQYRTVQDPYVGDITRLMGAGPEAEARSIRDIGNIRAEEAQQKGVIRSNLVQGLGQTVNQGYTAYRQEKADRIHQKLLEEMNPAALRHVGEDRVRPMNWNALSSAMIDTPVPQDRPPGKKAYTPPSADTPLPMPDREPEPFSGKLRETIGPYAAGFLRNVIPDASVEEPDEALPPDMVRRPDGRQKGEGYFGVLQRPDGRVSTELSINESENPLLFNEDGSRILYPSLVPTLTQEEIEWALAQPNRPGMFSDHPTGHSILRKAEAHALMRIKAGKSTFATSEDAPIGAVSIGDTGSFSGLSTEQRGKMFSMPPGQPFRASTEAKLPVEKAAPAPETMGEVLAPPAPLVQRDRGEKPRLYRYLTEGNLRDIAGLSRAMAREGVGADQIRRILAEDTAHNESVTTFNEQDRARGMRETTIRQENLLAHVLALNPEPSAELRERFINIFGPTDGIAKFKTYTDGVKALTDLQSGNFENMSEKLNTLVGLLELSDSPATRQQVYDQIIGVFEGAGIEVPQEIKEMPADPEVLRGVFARAFPEEPEATFAAQELKLEHAVANARTPEEKKVAEDNLARFIKGDIARHDRRRAPLGEGSDRVPPVAVVEMLIDAEEEYDDTIAEIDEAKVTGIFFGEYSLDETDYSKDEDERRRKVATARLERVKQRLKRWIPIEDTADKWRPPLVAPDQEGVPTVSSGLRNSAGLYLPSRGVNP